MHVPKFKLTKSLITKTAISGILAIGAFVPMATPVVNAQSWNGGFDRDDFRHNRFDRDDFRRNRFDRDDFRRHRFDRDDFRHNRFDRDDFRHNRFDRDDFRRRF